MTTLTGTSRTTASARACCNSARTSSRRDSRSRMAATTRSFLLCVALLSPSQSAFAAAPSNDRVNRATPVSSLPFQDVLNTSAATTSMNDPVCVGQGPTVWFRYRASQDGPVTADTFGSDYDTTLSVYTSTPGRMLTQIACNDDDDGLQSLVLFQATAGVTYYMMVGARPCRQTDENSRARLQNVRRNSSAIRQPRS